MTDKNQSDWMSSIKERFKAFPNLYYWLVDLVSPVYPDRKYKKILNSLSKDSFVINLGSGARKLSRSVINVDISPYKNVDVVADIFALPFPDNSLDGIINIVVLEHVSNANVAINEMLRILKPGGMIFSIVPFIQGYHASPHDYNRWTISGVEKLFSDFDIIEIGIGGGPTSSFLWIFQEWIATLLSFNIPILYRFLLLLFMLLTFPLKFLDLILSRYKSSTNIASNFYFFGKKRV
jgi:SAM-dependent methyltransferase